MENTGDNIKYTVESYNGYYWTEESSFNTLAQAIKELKHMKKSLPSWTFRLIESQWKVIEDNMKTPEELFDDIKNLALKVDNLKGWVQNDFDRMIADGTVTKEDLRNRLPQILHDFDDTIDELNVLKLNVYNAVKNVSIKL